MKTPITLLTLAVASLSALAADVTGTLAGVKPEIVELDARSGAGCSLVLAVDPAILD